MVHVSSKGRKLLKTLRKVFHPIHVEQNSFIHALPSTVFPHIKNNFDLLPTGKLYKYMRFTFTSQHTQERKRKDNHVTEVRAPQEYNRTLSPWLSMHLFIALTL